MVPGSGIHTDFWKGNKLHGVWMMQAPFFLFAGDARAMIEWYEKEV